MNAQPDENATQAAGTVLSRYKSMFADVSEMLLEIGSVDSVSDSERHQVLRRQLVVWCAELGRSDIPEKKKHQLLELLLEYLEQAPFIRAAAIHFQRAAATTTQKEWIKGIRGIRARYPRISNAEALALYCSLARLDVEFPDFSAIYSRIALSQAKVE